MVKNIKLLKKYRKQILFLAHQQIKKQYLETSFGIGWAIVKPLVYVFSFWFFFTVGLRTGHDVNGVPYILFLFAGSIPWFLMSELITRGSNVIRSNAVLVKTIKFPVMALPLINVLSRLAVHVVVMLIVFVFYMVYGGLGYFPDIYYINFIYYWFTMLVFFTSLTFILSSLNLIIKDIAPLVNSIMQPMFWLTPVLYTMDSKIGDLMMKIFNPLYYFILGYRGTMLKNEFFWTNPLYDIYIWIIIIIMYIIGVKLFNKIRPFMADLV